MSGLFRQEAIEHQRARLWGEVLIVQPQSFKWLVLAFLVSLLVLALFVSVQSYKRKETVAGYLMPQAGLVKIGSDRGGVVEQLLVENGQLVKANQPLIKVNLPRTSAAGDNTSQSVKDSLQRDLATAQQQLNSLDERLDSELNSLRSQLAGRKLEAKTIKNEIKIIVQQQTLAASQRKGAERLRQKGFVSQTRVDSLLSRELDLQQQFLNRKRLIDSIEVDVANLKTELSVRTPYSFKEQKVNLSRQIEALKRELANVELAAAYVIVAPIDGFVGDLVVYAGETLVSGRAVMTVRPENSELIARLLVPSRAAGLVAAGQAVNIQYDAFPYQRFGVFKGQIKQVSQGVLTPSEMPVPIAINEAFYLVDIQLDSQVITALGKEVLLKPGMQLKADIVLEERSLLEWLFEPLLTITGRF